MRRSNSGGVLFAEIHPVPPLDPSGGSIEGWVLLAVVLAVVIASGVFLTSRR